ncbi:NUDIX domain-containing protein [Bacillus sp. E(2018)]|uniref:NUDIX hydrolase n=1 Tax=Bacillus sp. E(2018) TaxID=2502239 RepID=UPI0025710D4E|nr:NUDIX domain-containing protein [Bacillus sp. E(2018)]
MNFNKIFEELNNEGFKSTVHREAVRAIIMNNDHILLVQSNRGDYKFPGGGVEEHESQTDGLIREVREETGYFNCVVNDKVGIIIERNINEFDSDVIFQMTSHYYLCDLINEEKVTQQLDEYEFEIDFTPKWVSLEDAINQNENLIKEFEKNSWLRREAFVLKELKNRIIPQTEDKVE